MKGFKHLTFHDRLKIEAMDNAGAKAKEIAEKLHVHISTIYRELERGRYEHLNSDYTTEERYSPDIAEQAYRENLAAKGPNLKIGKDHELAAYIEEKIINDGYSPAAIAGEIKVKGKKFATNVCKATIYSYIEKGVFLRLTNKDLPEKGKKKRKYRHVKKAARPSKGESIEKRPEEVARRNTFGNWEMDTVVGKQGTKKALLVLTERLTRHEIVILLKDKTAESVVKAINRLERRCGKLFTKIFRTITVDNGSEFANCAGMEQSCVRKGNRTKVYYCHPYCSSERGSNENQNRMIRRRHPKGTDFGAVSPAQVRKTEEWMNNYPRRIHGYRSAQDMFGECVAALL